MIAIYGAHGTRFDEKGLVYYCSNHKETVEPAVERFRVADGFWNDTPR